MNTRVTDGQHVTTWGGFTCCLVPTSWQELNCDLISGTLSYLSSKQLLVDIIVPQKTEGSSPPRVWDQPRCSTMRWYGGWSTRAFAPSSPRLQLQSRHSAGARRPFSSSPLLNSRNGYLTTSLSLGIRWTSAGYVFDRPVLWQIVGMQQLSKKRAWCTCIWRLLSEHTLQVWDLYINSWQVARSRSANWEISILLYYLQQLKCGSEWSWIEIMQRHSNKSIITLHIGQRYVLSSSALSVGRNSVLSLFVMCWVFICS